MWVVDRDRRLVRDVALSHVESRDQIRHFYFNSLTRANTRLRALVAEGILRRLETPFFSQSLYVVGKNAEILLGSNIAPLVAGRTGSPRFIQHALSVTNTRIRLLERGAREWRFEQQVRTTFVDRGGGLEVRPDGLAIFDRNRLLAVEVDLGHVAPSKFKQKLMAYDRFVTSGACAANWPATTFRLLTLTTGKLRAARLAALTPNNCSFEHFTETFATFGVPSVGAWS